MLILRRIPSLEISHIPLTQKNTKHPLKGYYRS